MRNEDNEQIIDNIIKHHGMRRQKIKAMEELAELIQAIAKQSHAKKGINHLIDCRHYDSLVQEIADVYIMLWQLEKIYRVPQSDIWEIAQQKLEAQKYAISVSNTFLGKQK